MPGPAGHLPRYSTRFIGRTQEITEVKRLLDTFRLVTLTGIGGAGKTRLAVQVASDLTADSPCVVYVADLTTVQDPGKLVPSVAAAAGASEKPGRAQGDALVEFLSADDALLILDNCDHLLDACADLAGELLERCPRLRLLATSREPLGVAGERSWMIPSMAVPGQAGSQPAERADEFDAVRLFADRAGAADGRFRLDEQTMPATLQVCRRLDGIPLAIELAAARVRFMPAEAVSQSLSDRFRLLAGGSQSAYPRQLTLQAVVEWSYDLLPPEGQILWRRLSAFTGGFSAEAAAAVCLDTPAEAAGLHDLLSRLAQTGLIEPEHAGGGARFRMHETVRQHGHDRLLSSGEALAVRERHQAYYLSLAGPEASAEDADNFRSALEWSIDSEPESGLRASLRLVSLFEAQESLQEARQWIDDFLGRLPGGSPLAAEGLIASGILRYRLEEYSQARSRLAEGLRTAVRLGDDELADKAEEWLNRVTQAQAQ